jgi:hypothetical protein
VLPFLSIPTLIIVMLIVNTILHLIFDNIPTIETLSFLKILKTTTYLNLRILFKWIFWRIIFTFFSRFLLKTSHRWIIEFWSNPNTRRCLHDSISFDTREEWLIAGHIMFMPIRPFPFLSIPTFVYIITNANAWFLNIIMDVPTIEMLNLLNRIIITTPVLILFNFFMRYNILYTNTFRAGNTIRYW